ncbi:MAG: rRNA pseudouridine synthase [Deltaproteobacteria bacterium]|nr:rRNA pseudouridine synthase [Deltaproteobacteria bacterium]
MENDGLRIQVYLARQGLGSRRKIEEWIRHGYIHVNSKPAKLGQKINPAKDQIKIRGKEVSKVAKQKAVVIALHKPRGVVSTAKDPEGRKTVLDLVPKTARVYPVGRLDINSEGLLIMTNDGELALRLTHPRYEIPKVYDVKIRGNLDDKKIAFLKKGVRIDETKVKGAEILSIRDVTSEGINKYQVQIKVFEGKNHHVRKMFEAIRCRVIRLKRLSMGPVSLRGVPRGGYRILPPGLVTKIRKEVGL